MSRGGVSDFRFPSSIPDLAIDPAGAARWLACKNVWGTLGTINDEQGGAPFGHVVSFSDGLPNQGRGIPYFYMTNLDVTVRNLMKDPRASFAISELPLGLGEGKDPQDPRVAKLTLTGKVEIVDRNSEEGKYALDALFSKHPQMKEWPPSHGFQPYKLEIEYLFLLDGFGGPKPLTVEEYLRWPAKIIE